MISSFRKWVVPVNEDAISGKTSANPYYLHMHTGIAFVMFTAVPTANYDNCDDPYLVPAIVENDIQNPIVACIDSNDIVSIVYPAGRVDRVPLAEYERLRDELDERLESKPDDFRRRHTMLTLESKQPVCCRQTNYGEVMEIKYIPEGEQERVCEYLLKALRIGIAMGFYAWESLNRSISWFRTKYPANEYSYYDLLLRIFNILNEHRVKVWITDDLNFDEALETPATQIPYSGVLSTVYDRSSCVKFMTLTTDKLKALEAQLGRRMKWFNALCVQITDDVCSEDIDISGAVFNLMFQNLTTDTYVKVLTIRDTCLEELDLRNVPFRLSTVRVAGNNHLKKIILPAGDYTIHIAHSMGYEYKRIKNPNETMVLGVD